MSVETWYYLHRATFPNTYYEAIDLLETMPISMRYPTNLLVTSQGSFVPVPAHNYVLIAGTKIYTRSNGSYTITLNTDASIPVTLYVMKTSTNNLTSYSVTNPVVLQLTAPEEYVFILIQRNSTINTTLFIKTQYTGDRQPKANAFTGGTGVTLDSSNSTIVTVGDYKWSARTGDFDGWLLCDGREVYRDAYPALFQIISTKFGSGNGTTTFNIPDARGRVAGGAGSGSNLTSRSIGSIAGTESHVLTTNELPSHTHTYQDAYFAEKITGGNLFGTNADTDLDNQFRWRTPNGGYSDSPQDLNTGSVGNGQSFSIMQPTIFIGNLFICAEL